MNDVKEKVLCKPLQQLKDEHSFLLEQIRTIYHLACELQQDSFSQDWNARYYQLYKQALSFLCQLRMHVYKEDHFLYPLLRKYLVEEAWTLIIMDYEHEKVKQSLKQFIETFESRQNPFEEIEALCLLASVEIAYFTLVDHFTKESSVVYLLAEQYLTEDEKKSLTNKMTLFALP